MVYPEGEVAFAPAQAQNLKCMSLSGPSRRQSATAKLARPKTVIDTPKKRSIALILSPIGLLLISAGRLIIVSNYNTTTAVTIAASGGYVSTLLGSVIPLVAIFAPYMALILLLLKRFLLSVMLFVFAAFITPSPLSLHDAARIASVDWRLGLTGAPLLVDAAVSMEGQVLGHFSVGDHEAFVMRGVRAVSGGHAGLLTFRSAPPFHPGHPA